MKKAKNISLILLAMLTIISGCGKVSDNKNINDTSIEKEEATDIKDSDNSQPESSEVVDTSESELNKKSMEAYQQFIDTREGLYFDIYEIAGYEKDRAYSLYEFLKTKKKNHEPALKQYSDLEYAFIDCGNDGVKELLIRYVFSGEPEVEGAYVYENVIKCIDERLEVCAEAVSHYRGNEVINEYGILMSGFIDFAGANGWSSESGVDKEGVFHEIMTGSTSYAHAIYGMYNGYSDDEPDFSELSEVCNELGDAFYVDSTEIEYGSMKGQRIFTYRLSGNEQYKGAIEDVFNKANVKLLQPDEYDKTIKSVIEEFGLTEETFRAGEPDFVAFPQTEESDSKELWVSAYLDYLSSLKPDSYKTAAMIYVNDDDIPEIILNDEWSLDNRNYQYITAIDGRVSVEDDNGSIEGLEYYERKNILFDQYIHAGFYADSICTIENGEWKTVFYSSFEDYWSGDELVQTNHRINGENVSEDEYDNTCSAIFEKYSFPQERKTVEFNYSIDELKKELKRIRAEAEAEKYKDELPWKTAYRKYLYDVIAGTECLPDLIEVFYYSPEKPVDFLLQDLTEDGIPELLIEGLWDTYWAAYTIDAENNLVYFTDLSFYNPTTKEIFVADGSSFENYSVYRISNGKRELEYTVGEGDREGQITPYYRSDGNRDTYYNISEEEMNAFRNLFDDGFNKYKPMGVKLIPENIDAEFNKYPE